MQKLGAAISVITLFLFSGPARSDTQPLTLSESRLFVAPSNQAQKLSETINLKSGQEKLRLTLTFYNGTDTKPSFKWLRISSASMNYITETAFAGQKTYSEDVTGELASGGNQLLITAGGPAGAAFGWRLTTPQPIVSSVSPSTAAAGSTITIEGENLCSKRSANLVTINGEQAQCLSATAHNLVVEVPEDMQSGQATAQITTAGLTAGSLKFAIDSEPVLTSLSPSWVYPDMSLTINGQSFGGDANAITVYLGPLKCNVLSATNTSITVSIPAAFAGSHWNYYQPVRVLINGVKAKNTLSVGVGDTG